MSLCPWCKATMPSGFGQCPTCGKDPADHPSLQGGGYGALQGFDDIEAPPGGLDLGPLSASKPLGDPAVGYGADRFNDGFDDDGEQESLKLEVESIPKPAAQPTLASPVTPGDATGAAPPALLQPSAALVAPSKPPSQHPALDPVEIAVLADFGPAPSAIWQCPGYALRVLRRKRELSKALREVQKSAADAEMVRDERLAAIAERVRPSLEGDREMAGYLNPLTQAEETAKEREKALASRSAEYSGIVGAIDQKIAAEESSAAELKTKLDAASSDYEAKAQTLTRAQAQLKRAEIELRNAQDVARTAAGPEARTAPPEHAEAILQAQKSVELRRTEVAEPKAVADAAHRIVRELERQRTELERKVQALRAERRRAEGTFSKEMGVRSEGLEQARRERRAALIAIGGRLFDTNSDLIPQDDFDAFHKIRADVLGKHLEIERTMRAIASADPAAIKRGWAILAAALVLLIVIVALTLSRLPS